MRMAVVAVAAAAVDCGGGGGSGGGGRVEFDGLKITGYFVKCGRLCRHA